MLRSSGGGPRDTDRRGRQRCSRVAAGSPVGRERTRPAPGHRRKTSTATGPRGTTCRVDRGTGGHPTLGAPSAGANPRRPCPGYATSGRVRHETSVPSGYPADVRGASPERASRRRELNPRSADRRGRAVIRSVVKLRSFNPRVVGSILAGPTPPSVQRHPLSALRSCSAAMRFGTRGAPWLQVVWWWRVVASRRSASPSSKQLVLGPARPQRHVNSVCSSGPSDGATGSVDCSTSISRSRDVCGVSGTLQFDPPVPQGLIVQSRKARTARPAGPAHSHSEQRTGPGAGRSTDVDAT